MKVLKRIIAGLASGIMMAGSMGVYAATDISSLPLVQPDVMEQSVSDVSQVIKDITEKIDIQHAEPETSYVYTEEPSYTQVYYSEPENDQDSLALTYDEFMLLFGDQLITDETEESESIIPADTGEKQAVYEQALANYNAAFAEYEAASQMVEITKEVEVEIVEEVTDEEGNVAEVTRTEIQTVTEMVPAGDVASAQLNLDAASVALDSASQALEVAQAQTTIVDQPKVEDSTPIPTTIVEPEQQVIIEDDVLVTEEVTQATSGKCGDNLTWTLDDNGLLTITGTGPMWKAAFEGISSIKSIIIEPGATTISDEAFRGHGSITDVTIPNTVTSIGGGAFYFCKDLINFNMSDSVTSIGSNAFVACRQLKSIRLSKNLKTIGTYAFEGCTGLTSIKIPDSVTTIETNAFCGCFNLATVNIPKGVRTLDSTFSQCTHLTNVTIEKGVTNLLCTFDECRSLTNIVLPDSVTTIGRYTFSDCTNLSTITIPGSVTSIDSTAFKNSTNIKDVYYQGTKKQWESKRLYSFGSNVRMHFIDGSLPFKDVYTDDWYYETVKDCYKTGLISGTSATTFSPKQLMTRAMVVTIIWRLQGSPKTTFKKKFKDVTSKEWYATAITWAVNNKVVNGYTDGTFKPDAAVTREQIAVMLANYASYRKVYKPGTKKLNTYPDGSKVSAYAQSGMKWALTNGIISGDGAGYLNPKKSATRAEGAAMLLRMKNWLK